MIWRPLNTYGLLAITAVTCFVLGYSVAAL
jgi:hypothetical protein